MVGHNDRIRTVKRVYSVAAIDNQKIVTGAAINRVGTCAADNQIITAGAADIIVAGGSKYLRRAGNGYTGGCQDYRQSRQDRRCVSTDTLRCRRLNSQIETGRYIRWQVKRQVGKLGCAQTPNPAANVRPRRQAAPRRQSAHLYAQGFRAVAIGQRGRNRQRHTTTRLAHGRPRRQCGRIGHPVHRHGHRARINAALAVGHSIAEARGPTVISGRRKGDHPAGLAHRAVHRAPDARHAKRIAIRVPVIRQ